MPFFMNIMVCLCYSNTDQMHIEEALKDTWAKVSVDAHLGGTVLC